MAQQYFFFTPVLLYRLKPAGNICVVTCACKLQSVLAQVVILSACQSGSCYVHAMRKGFVNLKVRYKISLLNSKKYMVFNQDENGKRKKFVTLKISSNWGSLYRGSTVCVTLLRKDSIANMWKHRLQFVPFSPSFSMTFWCRSSASVNKSYFVPACSTI